MGKVDGKRPLTEGRFGLGSGLLPNASRLAMNTASSSDPLLQLGCEVWGQAYCLALREHEPSKAEVRANEALARYAARVQEIRSTGIPATLARICHAMCEETLPVLPKDEEHRYYEKIRGMVEAAISAYEVGEDPEAQD